MEWRGRKILVTGAAGFIGYHLSRRLLQAGAQVLGVDNLNDYYDVQLKKDRLQNLKNSNFEFAPYDLNDAKFLQIWQEFNPDSVYHLAAQAGVRYSLTHPEKYISSNINGFFQVLEGAKKFKTRHLIYATSSSVYGNTTEVPFSTDARADQPVSIYAATKRSNELMAYSYSHLFKIPMTGLRFFTVYGSWGRPDMAYFSFTKSILANQPITLFAAENQKRDFTHVSDIVESMLRIYDHPPSLSVDTGACHRLLNIGASIPVPLMEFVSTLENIIGKKAILKNGPAQAGDVRTTYADVSALQNLTNYKPKVELHEGLTEFFNWYQDYYGGIPDQG